MTSFLLPVCHHLDEFWNKHKIIRLIMYGINMVTFIWYVIALNVFICVYNVLRVHCDNFELAIIMMQYPPPPSRIYQIFVLRNKLTFYFLFNFFFTCKKQIGFVVRSKGCTPLPIEKIAGSGPVNEYTFVVDLAITILVRLLYHMFHLLLAHLLPQIQHDHSELRGAYMTIPVPIKHSEGLQ